MDAGNISKIINALESAGIKDYEAMIDENYHFYNNDNSILICNGDDIINISRKSYVVGAEPFDAQTIVRVTQAEHVVYMAFGGDFKQVEHVVTDLGATLTDEQKKVLLKIDRSNYNVIPETGDYHPFKELTPEEYEALSPEDKAAYDAAKKENDAVKSGIHRGFTVRID